MIPSVKVTYLLEVLRDLTGQRWIVQDRGIDRFMFRAEGYRAIVFDGKTVRWGIYKGVEDLVPLDFCDDAMVRRVMKMAIGR